MDVARHEQIVPDAGALPPTENRTAGVAEVPQA
jgi:hypothetical protein